MKKLLIFLFLIILSSNAYPDSKFEKELKKVSKHNGFLDSNGKTYPSEQITDKKNTILIIYNHGSDYDQLTDKCTKPWNSVAQVIRDLHNKKIKNFNIKIYKRKPLINHSVKPLIKSKIEKIIKKNKRNIFFIFYYKFLKLIEL